MVKKNVFVLLGKDPQYKKIQSDKIKSGLLKEDPALILVSFYASTLSLSALQEELENFAFSARLFIFRESQALAAEIKD